MKKLKLDELKVDSFAIPASEEARGTVLGAEAAFGPLRTREFRSCVVSCPISLDPADCP